MKIRLEGTPTEVKAFADALCTISEVHPHFKEYRNRPPSKLVRRYLDAELGDVPAGQRAAPLQLAEQAKQLRDLGAEITILNRADADLNAQPWLPLRAGDIVLQGFVDHPDLSETYLAVPDDSNEGAGLALISSHYEIHEGTPLIPFYDLWFEAGRDSLTVIRNGMVIFGGPLLASTVAIPPSPDAGA